MSPDTTSERENHPLSPPQTSALPPGAWDPLVRATRLVQRPLERFLHVEAASGILLLLATTLALVWANSPAKEAYFSLIHTPWAVRFGEFSFSRDLEWLVNDGLMVIFFFVVGLEIRREIHSGELSEWRRAALPALAAIGGMVVPAGIYLALAGGPETHSGWGVPMATDIAFAVGILALLGKRVPPALRVLLLALAVIDDLGAIVVIALFYSGGLDAAGFALAGMGIASVFALRFAGVRRKVAYLFPGVVIWAGIYQAGIHPTIAGVILGMMTPVTAWFGERAYVDQLQVELSQLGSSRQGQDRGMLLQMLRRVHVLGREAVSPAEVILDALHPWVAYGIMPLFAFANAGVVLGEFSFQGNGGLAALAVFWGLVLGKPVGVIGIVLVSVRLGVCVLPRGISFRHLLVLGLVAGIGFTMSLFVASLAFPVPALLGAAKVGVLLASLVAGVAALLVGRLVLPSRYDSGAAKSVDEAEASTEL